LEWEGEKLASIAARIHQQQKKSACQALRNLYDTTASQVMFRNFLGVSIVQHLDQNTTRLKRNFKKRSRQVP
jgi:hypothetical protein